jgi:serine phosphatase RsbU (regulator of sigma subunit)/DNA-binding LacI/PurR family transcriptional regulator
MTESMPSNAIKQRLTIGYLAPMLHGNSLPQWMGVIDAARKYDVNLICFPGWSLNFPEGTRFHDQANILYDLVGRESVDGIISWSSSIGNHSTLEEMTAFHQRFHPLPVVTIGQIIEGYPGLLMDSYEGMREAMLHLIEDHGYRKIAFIRGPKHHFYAQERYRAYRETLDACGIPFEPNLVSEPGNWSPDTGRAAMNGFLNVRKLRPQHDFQAIACANDGLALIAMDILQQKDFQIPNDIAVTGFDDTVWGQMYTPPLTSVRVPFYETGYRAVEVLLDVLRGESAPGTITVPSRLSTRQTCGCFDPAIVQVSRLPEKISSQPFFAAIDKDHESIINALRQVLPARPNSCFPELVETLLDAFLDALRDGANQGFIKTLNVIISRSIDNEDDVLTWQRILSAVYAETLPCFSRQDFELLRQADNLWQLARLILGRTVMRIRKNQELNRERHEERLRELDQAMITTFDVGDLMDLLASGLPMLQIPACYVALYDKPSAYGYPGTVPPRSSLVLAYNSAEPDWPKGRMPLKKSGELFPSRCLLPDSIRNNLEQIALVVEPLYFRTQQIGFMVCETGPRGSEVYDVLRGQLSSSLQGALLVQKEKESSFELAAAYEEIQSLNESLKEENVRMGAELNVARRLQDMILPRSEELQHIDNLDIAGYMQPADEVGGDYYDVLKRPDMLHIGIGDVTGHGLESGVLMLMTQTVIRTLIEHGETDPKAFLTTLNRTIYENTKRMQVEKTLTFALLEYQQGQLKIVGQHEELLVVRHNSGQQTATVERINTIDLGFPIGLEKDIDRWVDSARISLEPGDGVVLYTDGVTEADNMENEQYGLERLCDVVSRNWRQPAEDVKDAILEDVMRHIGKQKIYDDITLVVLKQQER